ncbi:MAG: cupin domain-containing protein [Armatimonadota bacterium]|nr:cupin domain-containing protein [Armatimonadota bacterium]MDR7450644.1 cupin domain-containing protein [Armatimonadota bacterium]MDR7466223.1 cupin domain-containing protein [Armatimonadota bacterium]MDR7492944.1 cupin domain-containing protein [Armatimonadota bacterium]MDR7498299.1 cupin domain-containing protein [Armatimonadota bacterium]
MDEERKADRPEERTTRTAGAIKAGRGRYVFDPRRLAGIAAGPGYSTAHGPVVEGERIQVGLMHMPRGSGGRPHSHPNEQWIYVLQGTLEGEVEGVPVRAPAGSLIYIPANAVHWALAGTDEDVVFLTAKDTSHGIAGTPVDPSTSAPLYAPGFGPAAKEEP